MTTTQFDYYSDLNDPKSADMEIMGYTVIEAASPPRGVDKGRDDIVEDTAQRNRRTYGLWQRRERSM